MSSGERRYFLALGLVAGLSLLTIGTTEALRRYVGPATEVVPFLVQRASTGSESAGEGAPAFRIDEATAEMPLAGEPPAGCRALVAPARWLPEMAANALEEDCRRFD